MRNSTATATNFRNFIVKTRKYWKESVSDQPKDSPARFPHGSYEIAFALLNSTPAENLRQLQSRLGASGEFNHSGWPAFPILHVPGWAPRPMGRYIETHLGKQNSESEMVEDAHHCNFWRVSLDNKLYVICGYREDSGENPGRVLYDSSLIWRLGESVLFINRYIRTLAKIDRIFINCRFTGLKKRRIVDAEIPGLRRDIYICEIEELSTKVQTEPQQLKEDTANVIYSILEPLYEQFNFCPLNIAFVSKELNELQQGRFH